MSSLFRSPLLWIIFLITGLLVTSASVVSCRHHSDLDSVAINPAFAANPPLAQDITIQKLDQPTAEGNTLLKVTFPKGRIGAPYLAFTDDGKKVVLRDDGQSPDEKPGDDVYTGIVNIDLSELQNIQSRQTGKTNEAVPVTNFQGRLVTGVSRLQPLDLASFLTGGILHLRFPPFPAVTTLLDSVQSNSIFVTAPSVVEDTARTYDPCSNKGHKLGPWTFGYLMTQLANNSSTGVSPSRFVLNWLLTYTVSTTFNHDPLDARPNMAAFIHSWLEKSNGLNDSTLDLSIAPFRLMAIVNRLDLRASIGYLGNGGNSGEGRFVFAGLDSNCAPMLFTVIFEYGVNKTICASVRAYAQEWYNLKNFTIGSAAYDSALQHITDQFSVANTNPAKPNGSSLDQLRTNETAFGSQWELREFNIDSANHFLFNTSVKETPQTKFNQQTILDSFMRQNAKKIKTNTDIVPLLFSFHGSDTNFLAGVAPVPPVFWAEPGATLTTNDTVREMFSLNTCNGCHNLETGTLFRHVSPAASFGSPATLSGFLTGTMITDPAEIPGTWQFADLQRRAQDLVNLVNAPCLFIQFSFKPLNMTH